MSKNPNESTYGFNDKPCSESKNDDDSSSGFDDESSSDSDDESYWQSFRVSSFLQNKENNQPLQQEWITLNNSFKTTKKCSSW